MAIVRTSQIIANNFCPLKPGVRLIIWAVVNIYKGNEQMRVTLIRTLYRLEISIRFIFFIISIISATYLWANLLGGGLMASFLSVPYQKGANNEGAYFSIETATSYNLGVHVEAYGQKKVLIKVFKVTEGENIVLLDTSTSTHTKNKNVISFPIYLKEGDYYFSFPSNKLKKIRLYQRKPTSPISKLFYDLDRNMLAGYMSLIAGALSILYIVDFILCFLPTLISYKALFRGRIC
ncbi:hypothetical protein [Psychromonas sp. Urea-02u-13]|uniref:hypothetical protein n=1 Tax=Psychromonas sp. Urea-02u-13 TaxID=2058326 RepID=UPI000C335AC3|nr:hypothetical protein [Psychromonas sp. Urea-02u-13]PKG37044.1 hypothetical protein CXF74_20955 [Psychromonas sp. Urea-02u-13]